MPALAQFLLNLRNALSKDSFSLTITLDMRTPKPPFGHKLRFIIAKPALKSNVFLHRLPGFFFAVPFSKSKSHRIVLFSIEELIFKNK